MLLPVTCSCLSLLTPCNHLVRLHNVTRKCIDDLYSIINQCVILTFTPYLCAHVSIGCSNTLWMIPSMYSFWYCSRACLNRMLPCHNACIISDSRAVAIIKRRWKGETSIFPQCMHEFSRRTMRHKLM